MDKFSDLAQYVIHYYDRRGLVWPRTFDQAMWWLQTELGEVGEIWMAQHEWVRNNPEDKPDFDRDALMEELGDCIMMLVVAGLIVGGDPVEALCAKMLRKMGDE